MTNHNSEDKVRTFVNKGLESAREIIEEQAAKLKDRVDNLDVEQLPAEVKSYMKKNPWTAAAIAAGVGFLVGYVAKSVSRESEE
jgi:ElaB/YqjD/DUF883 family membrane-anchored ribosome-binding protein